MLDFLNGDTSDYEAGMESDDENMWPPEGKPGAFPVCLTLTFS